VTDRLLHHHRRRRGLLEADARARQRGENLDGTPRREAVTLAAGGAVRVFATGANRNADHGKLDYDGFLSPLALEAFATYMHFNRLLPDGSLRDSDNWQKGIPEPVYRKSMWRHFIDVWRALRGYPIKENIVWALCGLLFNVQGILHERLKADPALLDRSLAEMEVRRAAARARRAINRRL
jgi:hypothetical protein